MKIHNEKQAEKNIFPLFSEKQKQDISAADKNGK
jgi:hypothetical protein